MQIVEIPKIYEGFPLAYKKAVKKLFSLEDKEKLVADFRKELEDDCEKHIARFRIDLHFALEIIASKMEDKNVSRYIIEELENIKNENDLKLFLAGMEAAVANDKQTPSIQKLFDLVEWYK